MNLSVAAEAASSFDGESRAFRSWRMAPWVAWLFTLVLVVVLVIDSVLLHNVLGTTNESRRLFRNLSEEIKAAANDGPWPSNSQHLHYECLYGLSGGTVGSTGHFPQSRLHNSQLCQPTLDWYFKEDSGQYWRDLRFVGQEALHYYTGGGGSFKRNDAGLLLIFDIDETTLSNLGSLQANQYGLGDEVASSQHPQRHSSNDMAPPIEAIKAVYLAAYNYGMSVAFITGRSEDGRDLTEANLKDAGYGEKCAKDASGKTLRSTGIPCYVELHLRNLKNDMNKLASVYKPERRKTFVDAGYSIIGTFGDQYSDLEGLYPASASWKLPNPIYYIL